MTLTHIRRLALLSALILPSSRLLAQSINSSIQGTVADATSAILPESDVTLRNVETGVTLKAQTNSAGSYSFPSVPPGRYSLTVNKSGFAPYEVPSFTVVVGEHATQNATLGITSTQVVTVDANSTAHPAAGVQ